MKNQNNLSIIALLCARLFAGLGLLFPCAGYCQDDARKTKDFSKTNTVSMLLAEAERWSGLRRNGLEHLFWERDGMTTIMNVEGVPCRCLSLRDEGESRGYLYFILAPDFKDADAANVKIEVEYFDGFDGKTGVFGVQYDATGAGNGVDPPAYTRVYQTVQLKGSGKWLNATFHVQGATFANSQNGRVLNFIVQEFL